MARIPKRERLMNLVSALLASREPIPFREIAGRVIGYDDGAGGEAMEKRFDRDKADLRRLGIPIEYQTGDEGTGSGYIIRQEDVFQQKVTFTPQESLLLAIAGRVGAAATGGGALEEALKSALRKLAVDLVGPDPLEDVAPVTVLRARSGDPQALENVSELAQATSKLRRVKFSYRKVNAEKAADRRVDPYGLGLYRGAWYLVGFCDQRQAIRCFKVARIEGAVRIEAPDSTDRAFSLPIDFKIEDHVGREAWDLGDGTPQVVRLGVQPHLNPETLMPHARDLGTEGGLRVLQVEVRRPEALVPWILSRGGEVRVLAPQSLQDRVREDAEHLLNRYRRTADQGVLPQGMAASSAAAQQREFAAGEHPAPHAASAGGDMEAGA